MRHESPDRQGWRVLLAAPPAGVLHMRVRGGKAGEIGGRHLHNTLHERRRLHGWQPLPDRLLRVAYWRKCTMNLFKLSTLALALALTGWVACSSSSNNNTDVPNIGGTGGTAGSGGAGGMGGAAGIGGAGGIGGAA